MYAKSQWNGGNRDLRRLPEAGGTSDGLGWRVRTSGEDWRWELSRMWEQRETG